MALNFAELINGRIVQELGWKEERNMSRTYNVEVIQNGFLVTSNGKKWMAKDTEQVGTIIKEAEPKPEVKCESCGK